jgi:16S rRNA (guanine966-N2)-methyltransferase
MSPGQKFFAELFFKKATAFLHVTVRIIAGDFKGRKLEAPPGLETRPTNARARQAVFDMLLHASWAGSEFLRAARVLDVFAGTGAYGLEALSRGAAFATFIESAPPALAALRKNIAACRVEAQSRIIPNDALNPPPGTAHHLIFLDPPYGENLIPKALAALQSRGWLAPNALVIAELGPADAFTLPDTLAVRAHGKARLLIGRI